MRIKTIVAAIALENAVDQSVDAMVARRAIALATQHQARLILVHAIENLPETGAELPAQTGHDALARIIQDDAISLMKQLVQNIDISIEFRTEPEKSNMLIERVIEEVDADLLIIGPGKPQNLREKIFGSTADRIVRSGPCPILVVKREGDMAYQRIIAAIDFSPMSFAAAQAAVILAPQATPELIHALEIPLGFEQAMLKTGTSQAEVDRYRKARARKARAQLRATSTELALSGPIKIVQGDPAMILVRLARSSATDLVALGTQGRNAVAKMVLGSVARRVLAGASCDVLLTREKPDLHHPASYGIS